MGRDEQDARGTMIGTGAVLLSLLSMNLGAAFAKTLFPLVGAPGVAALRILLAALLLVGSVLGAQFGTRIALKLKPDWLRLALATIVLLVALRMLFGLSIQPDEVYSVVNL